MIQHLRLKPGFGQALRLICTSFHPFVLLQKISKIRHVTEFSYLMEKSKSRKNFVEKWSIATGASQRMINVTDETRPKINGALPRTQVKLRINNYLNSSQ